MIYHYLTWTLGIFSADTFMGRFGIYGVSIFYVLSGLTLYYVYYDKMKPSKEEIVSFFKKRAFRIFPLLWLVTFVAIFLSRKIPDFTNLFLNLSGLFGFIRWDKYFSPGVYFGDAGPSVSAILGQLFRWPLGHFPNTIIYNRVYDSNFFFLL